MGHSFRLFHHLVPGRSVLLQVRSLLFDLLNVDKSETVRRMCSVFQSTHLGCEQLDTPFCEFSLEVYFCKEVAYGLYA